MIEIISGNTGYTYILRKGDRQVRYGITYKAYFDYGRMCNIDEYIKDYLKREMKKLMNYDI